MAGRRRVLELLRLICFLEPAQGKGRVRGCVLTGWRFLAACSGACSCGLLRGSPDRCGFRLMVPTLTNDQGKRIASGARSEDGRGPLSEEAELTRVLEA